MTQCHEQVRVRFHACLGLFASLLAENIRHLDSKPRQLGIARQLGVSVEQLRLDPHPVDHHRAKLRLDQPHLGHPDTQGHPLMSEAECVTLYSNRSRLGMKSIRRHRPVKGGDLLPETFSFVA